MNQSKKAAEQMRKNGINAYENDGRVFVKYPKPTHPHRYWTIRVSERDVKNWAYLYDADKVQEEVQKIRDADPYETLEEIARIFHYLGWHVGNDSDQDTDFIKSSQEFLELVYKAFNTNNKK